MTNPLRNARPLPAQLADRLRERIADGQWEPGHRLPSEQELAIEYGVSRPTVRSAVARLVDSGMLRVRHGAGTFVTSHQGGIQAGLQELRSTSRIIAEQGYNCEVVYRSRELRAATAEEAERFGGTAGLPVIAIERCFLADDEVVAFEHDLINAEILPANVAAERHHRLGVRVHGAAGAASRAGRGPRSCGLRRVDRVGTAPPAASRSTCASTRSTTWPTVRRELVAGLLRRGQVRVHPGPQPLGTEGSGARVMRRPSCEIVAVAEQSGGAAASSRLNRDRDAGRPRRRRPALSRRPARPAALRRLRGAPGPVRLRRHLRAGAPDGRRRRLPHRRHGPRPRARRHARSATRAATSCPDTAGRTASARATGGPGGSTWPGTRPRPTRSASTSSPPGPSGSAPRSCSPSTWAPAASRRRWTCWSTRTSAPARRGPTPASPTAAPSPTASGCGAWETRWTARGSSGTAAPPTTASSPRGRPRGCGSWTPTSSWWCAAAPTRSCRRSGPGSGPSWSTPTTSSTYISCHAYYELTDGDLGAFLASERRHGPLYRRRSWRPPTTWPRSSGPRSGSTSPSTSGTSGTAERFESVDKITGIDNWPVAPRLLEDSYTVADAVVVGSLLITLLRHADRVRSANLAQLVNVIAPIMTEPGGPAWRQTIFHPFATTSRLARGTVLDVRVTCGTYPTAAHGDVPLVDAVATHDADTGRTAVFLVHRGPGRPRPGDPRPHRARPHEDRGEPHAGRRRPRRPEHPRRARPRRPDREHVRQARRRQPHRRTAAGLVDGAVVGSRR